MKKQTLYERVAAEKNAKGGLYEEHSLDHVLMCHSQLFEEFEGRDVRTLLTGLTSLACSLEQKTTSKLYPNGGRQVDMTGGKTLYGRVVEEGVEMFFQQAALDHILMAKAHLFRKKEGRDFFILSEMDRLTTLIQELNNGVPY